MYKELVKLSADTFVQQWVRISFTNCSGIALVNPIAPSINGVARIYCQFVFNDRGNKRNLINNNWVGHISCSTSKIGFPAAVFYCFATRKQGFGPILTENWAECPNFWAGTKTMEGQKWGGKSLTSIQPTSSQLDAVVLFLSAELNCSALFVKSVDWGGCMDT